MKNAATKTGARTAEERLRGRIRRSLTQSGLNRLQTAHAMRRVEKLTLKLFKDFSTAPIGKRAEVYTKGEKKILKAIQERD